MEFNVFKAEFHRQVWHLPHHRLKEISKELTRASQTRYPSAPSCKVEAVERGFTDKELARFLAVIEDQEDRAAFMLMASLGLRVGELAALRGKDLESEKLRITGSKGGYSGYLRLPPSLLSIIPACGPEDHIFPRHAELRRRFALYRAESGLTEVYAYGEPGGRSRTRRPLYRLSMHSMRHYFIQRVQTMKKDIDLTRRAARHKKFETTIRYLRCSRQAEIESVVSALANQSIYIPHVVAKSGIKNHAPAC